MPTSDDGVKSQNIMLRPVAVSPVPVVVTAGSLTRFFRRWISWELPLPLPLPTRYLLAVAVFAAAVAVRFLILPIEAGVGFITFYPATVFSALLLGSGPGMVTMLLGSATIQYVFMAPHWTLKITFEQVLMHGIYITSGTAICLIVEQTFRRTMEVRQAHRELDAAYVRLKDIDKLKSMFIASMSHELRTPLNSIIGFSKVLANEWAGPLNGEQRDNLAIISRAGKHLLGLINDMIDVSKIEAGKMEVRLEEFNLAEVRHELFEMMGKEARERGLLFTMEMPSRRLHTDRQRLSQCLLNLIGNSLKYTERGSVYVRALPAANPANTGNGYLHIIVEDTGIGISAEDARNLFSPFVRFSSHLQTKEKGTGLGLYLTKKLATRVLRGDILYEPRPEGGSRFILAMPEMINEAPEAPEPAIPTMAGM